MCVCVCGTCMCYVVCGACVWSVVSICVLESMVHMLYVSGMCMKYIYGIFYKCVKCLDVGYVCGMFGYVW